MSFPGNFLISPCPYYLKSRMSGSFLILLPDNTGSFIHHIYPKNLPVIKCYSK